MRYTVLLHHPDWTNEFAASDRIVRVYVDLAGEFDERDAVETAAYQAATEYSKDPADFEPVAIYAGELFDLYMP